MKSKLYLLTTTIVTGMALSNSGLFADNDIDLGNLATEHIAITPGDMTASELHAWLRTQFPDFTLSEDMQAFDVEYKDLSRPQKHQLSALINAVKLAMLLTPDQLVNTGSGQVTDTGSAETAGGTAQAGAGDSGTATAAVDTSNDLFQLISQESDGTNVYWASLPVGGLMRLDNSEWTNTPVLAMINGVKLSAGRFARLSSNG